MWTFFLWSSPELGIAVNPKANLENPCWELGFLFTTEFFAKIWRYQRVSNVLWKNKQADEVDWRITVLGPNRENIFLDLRTPHKWFAGCLSQTSFISIRSSSLLARRENRPTENGTYRRVKLLNEAIPNIAKKKTMLSFVWLSIEFIKAHSYFSHFKHSREAIFLIQSILLTAIKYIRFKLLCKSAKMTQFLRFPFVFLFYF